MQPDPEKPTTNEMDEDDEVSPIEEVRLTVSNTDDPTRPNQYGISGCGSLALSYALSSQFFAYRTEPLIITQITVQVATLPVGHFMAAILPRTKFTIPGFVSKSLSINLGTFNKKEHVLITVLTLSKHFMDAASHLSLPGFSSLQLRALHEKDDSRVSRTKFFFFALLCSLSWYVVPGYVFTTLTSISWVCWIFPKSVTAQLIGSGMKGLGLGAFTLDWAAVASFLFSPLISPFFAIVNVFVGYALVVYVIIPMAYWGLNVYNANRFPILSSHLFTAQGQKYNISAIVDNQFELNVVEC